MAESVLIKNATILSLSDDTSLSTGDILVEKNKIAAIGENLTSDVAKVLDASGLVAMPGFIQTHTHLCQTLFRNYANDLQLLDWLKRRIWPFEAAHTPASLAASARLGIIELIKSGTTTILDFGSVYHTEAILEEVAASGLRASVGVTFMDEGDEVPPDLLRPAADSLQYFRELTTQWHNFADRRITINLSPRFALSCSKQILQELGEISKSEDFLLHTHSSENRQEVAFIRDRFDVGNVMFYHKCGMTGPNLCLAHCIWLDEEEIEILKETDTRVLHCPTANLKLASGIADIPRYLNENILCSIGTDGPPCNNNLNMFTEMRLAGLIQKPKYGPKIMPAKTLVEMATIQGAKTMHLESQIGSLEVGKKADIILLDLKTINCIPGSDIFNQLVYSAQTENVRTVLIDGKIIMENRNLLAINENEAIATAEQELKMLLEKVKLS